MKNSLGCKWFGIGLYISLILALSFSFWSFIQSNLYYEKHKLLLYQTYEIQWRTSQVHEKLTNIIGDLKLATKTQIINEQLDKQLKIIEINAKILINLDYIDNSLSPYEINLLEKILKELQNFLIPLIKKKNYNLALKQTIKLYNDMLRVSGIAISHNEFLNSTTLIEANALQNQQYFFLALSISLLLLTFIFIHYRFWIVRRANTHLQSFSALFSHMTRTRVAALRLFIEQQEQGIYPSPSMLTSAHRVVHELTEINEDLIQIAYAGLSRKNHNKMRRQSLGDILEAICASRQISLLIDAPQNVLMIKLPASQFYTIIDEIMSNAQEAVEGYQEPKIQLRVYIQKRFLYREHLVIDIIDNGIGMTSEIQKEAKSLFFSTRSGPHLGLGLPSCVSILHTMKGRLIILSNPGQGTKVQITYPLS